MAGLDLNKKLWRIPQRGMVKGVCAGSPISSFVKFNSLIIFFNISLLGKAFSLSILTYCLKDIPSFSAISSCVKFFSFLFSFIMSYHLNNYKNFF